MNYQITSIRVETKDLEKLKSIAKENNRSLNYIINEMIRKSLVGQSNNTN